MSTKHKEEEEEEGTDASWAKCLGTASLVFTLLAASLIWMVRKLDE